MRLVALHYVFLTGRTKKHSSLSRESFTMRTFYQLQIPTRHLSFQQSKRVTDLFFPVAVQAVREVVQAVVHSLHTPADPLGHATLSVPVLWQALPPEVWHEEAHLHPHRWVIFVFTGWGRREGIPCGGTLLRLVCQQEKNMATDKHVNSSVATKNDWALKETHTQAHYSPFLIKPLKIQSWLRSATTGGTSQLQFAYLCQLILLLLRSYSFRTWTLLVTRKSKYSHSLIFLIQLIK